MKVFISQKMNGLTELEILNQRERAIDILKVIYKGEEIEVLDTVFNLEEGTHPLVYLGKSIEVLSEADVAFFCKDWEKARGCLIEMMCCKKYGIKTLSEVNNNGL